MAKDIIIIGASFFGKEVVGLLEDNNSQENEWNILGFVDEYREVGSEFFGYPILGNVDWLLEYPTEISAVVAIGTLSFRESMATRIVTAKSNVIFPTIISHRASIISEKTTQIGEGTVICAGVVISVDTKIGKFTLVNINVAIGHDSIIDDFATLSPGSVTLGGSSIGRGGSLGAGSVVLPKKTIGKYADLGAGAVAFKDIPDYCLALGNPARVIQENKPEAET